MEIKKENEVSTEYEGEVVHGRGLGKTVDMPTANIDVLEKNFKLKYGVYVTKVFVDGKEYEAVTKYGPNPTVTNEKTACIEAFIQGLDEDLYGRTIKVKFHYYIREIVKYNSLEEVKKQVDEDIKITREYYKSKK